MNKQKIVEKVESYVYDLFKNDDTGHDYYHMKRVAYMARHIAESESADEFIAEVGGWLHDIGDKKLFKEPLLVKKDMYSFLERLNLTVEQLSQIEKAVSGVSFSGGQKPLSKEGEIVQDADRLDAIGALGIARTFAYGGSNQQLIHSDESKNTSIQHFYDKLLLLKDLINTDTAKKLAEERHQFMNLYLEQFYSEWNIN
nr:HD domain-containing protein [Aquibacillus saliphilus]